MPTTERAFLQRIAAKVRRGAEAPPPPGDLEATAAEIRGRNREGWRDLFGRFRAELEAVAGTAQSVPSGESAVDRIVELARAKGGRRVATWNLAGLGLPGLEAALGEAGFSVTQETSSAEVPPDPASRLAYRQEVARADLGVSGTDFAIAETGTLVLLSGGGKGRLVSALPVTHVGIIRPTNLIRSLEELGVFLTLLSRRGEDGFDGSCVSLITGPSRTADIELSLTRGVHGPREVFVILIEEG